MAGMAGNGWKWLEMAGLLELTGNGLKWLEIAVNSWKWPEWQEMAGHGWKWLENAGNGWNGTELRRQGGSVEAEAS